MVSSRLGGNVSARNAPLIATGSCGGQASVTVTRLGWADCCTVHVACGKLLTPPRQASVSTWHGHGGVVLVPTTKAQPAAAVALRANANMRSSPLLCGSWPAGHLLYVRG